MSMDISQIGAPKSPKITLSPCAIITAKVAGRASEQYLMWTLAGLTAASVLYVLIGGGSAQ